MIEGLLSPTCYVSHVTIFFYKAVKLVVGGSVIKRATLSSFIINPLSEVYNITDPAGMLLQAFVVGWTFCRFGFITD